MEYATVIDQAVKQFYAEGNNDVHSWLLRVQSSPEAWTFVWELLGPSKVRGISLLFPCNNDILEITVLIFIIVERSTVLCSYYVTCQNLQAMG